MAAGLALAAITPAHAPLGAIPLAKPHAEGSASPTAAPPPNELPIDSSIAFVLDGTISSAASKAGDVVNAHLKDALVVNGVTIAVAGAPERIRVLDAKPADNPDIYGFVDIYFYPLLLNTGSELPIRAPSSHLSVNISAGHESTAGIENTVGDIFTPTMLLHIFRKGRNFTLEPGAVMHAQTQASILVSGGTISITTPAPLILDAQMPHSSFKAMPLSTPSVIDRSKLVVPSQNPFSPFPSPTPTI